MSKIRVLIQVIITATALAGAARAEDPPRAAARARPGAPFRRRPKRRRPRPPRPRSPAATRRARGRRPRRRRRPTRCRGSCVPSPRSTSLRSDTAVAFYDNGAGAKGSTVATMLLASYKLTPSLAPMVRLGFVAERRAGDGRRRHVVRQPDRRRDVREEGRLASAGRRSSARPFRSARAAATCPTRAPPAPTRRASARARRWTTRCSRSTTSPRSSAAASPTSITS